MINNFFIVRKLNAADDLTVRSVETMLLDCIHAYHFEHIHHAEEINENTLVVAIGGDGTMLNAMRLAHEYSATATGINLGKVGFLTDFPNDDNLQYMLDFLVAAGDRHPVEERIVLKCRKYIAFNEFVISSQYSDDLIKYKLAIGGMGAGEYRANALIVGTPTGSTAYTLSAGGGLLLPSMEAMQIVPVAPISLTSRPIIIPSKEMISVDTQNWVLKSDGKPVSIYDNYSSTNSSIVITQHERKVKILHHMGYTFFDMLTKKLGWRGI